MATRAKEPYDFDERMDWMLKERKLLDKEFYRVMAHNSQFVQMGKSPSSIRIQRDGHIDIFFVPSERFMALQHGDPDSSVTVDEKIDDHWRPTIFAEEWSVKNKKRGWMYPGVSEADLLLWAYKTRRPQGLKVFIWKLPELIEWYWDSNANFRLFEIPNKSYVTVGRSVEHSWIPDDITVMEGFQVYPGMHDDGDQLKLFMPEDEPKPPNGGAYNNEYH